MNTFSKINQSSDQLINKTESIKPSQSTVEELKSEFASKGLIITKDTKPTEAREGVPIFVPYNDAGTKKYKLYFSIAGAWYYVGVLTPVDNLG